jgi:class 3 adenylate cyclase/alpha-beta hydrolase superfamily lysophospholipase
MGDGPLDVVVVPGVLSHVEFFWEFPGYEQFMRGVAAWARVIIFDKRGNGMSDPVDHAATLEERADDITAVMEAAGSRSCVLMGTSEGGSLGALFAATFPDRVTHLVMYGAPVRLLRGDDFPWGLPADAAAGFLADAVANWGSGVMAPVLFTSRADDPKVREQCGRMERVSASPGGFERQMQMNALIDVRDILPLVRVPTLVCQGANEFFPVEMSEYTASRIPHARLAEVPLADHYFVVDDVTPLLAMLREFVTGDAVDSLVDDRVLKTVLYTDVVDSTATVAQIGDARWRALLDQHDSVVRRVLDRYRGVEVNTTGDGFFAVFDGPGRAVRCALAAIDAARSIGLAIRAGVHAGECERRGSDFAGIALHVGARVASLAEPGEVLVTSTVRDLVAGSGIAFTDRGCHTLKGVPGEWTILAAKN